MKLPLCLLTLLVALAPLHAATEQTITFAVPEVDGRISLGVYDANKKLVRTLATGATDQDFKIGLNGLITTWDGKNDAGEPLPAGKYDVKGYVVSDQVKSEGVAFHFNDWITDEDSPRFANPRVIGAKGAAIRLSGDARLGGYAVPNDDPGWIITVLYEDDKLQLVKNDAGETQVVDEKAIEGAAFKGSQFASFPLKDNNDLADVLSDGQEVSINRPSSVLLKEGRMHFSLRGFSMGVTKINSLSAGAGETFWIVAQPQPNENGTPGAPVVRQYSLDGELLRQIAGDFPATTIFADKTENRIYLTHVDGATTTIKGLRPVESKIDAAPAATATPAPAAEPTDAPKTAEWEIFLEKTSTLCPKFGLVDGKLVADAGATEQKDSVRLDLPPSTMDQKQHTLVIHVKGNQDGEIWATGSGGIRLTLVGKLPGVDRVVVAKGEKPGEIRVYAGNGVVVAEYLVSGLDEIAEINAGEIELP